MDVLVIVNTSISDNETTINLLGSMPKSYASIVMVQTRNIGKLVDMIKLYKKRNWEDIMMILMYYLQFYIKKENSINHPQNLILPNPPIIGLVLISILISFVVQENH